MNDPKQTQLIFNQITNLAMKILIDYRELQQRKSYLNLINFGRNKQNDSLKKTDLLKMFDNNGN